MSRNDSHRSGGPRTALCGLSLVVILVASALATPVAAVGSEAAAGNEAIAISIDEASGVPDDGVVTDDARFRALVETNDSARVVVSRDERYQPSTDLTAVGTEPEFDLGSVSGAAGGWTVYAAANATTPSEPDNGTALGRWADVETRLFVVNTSTVRAEAADAAWKSGGLQWRGAELFLKSDRPAVDAGAMWVLYEVRDGELVRHGGVTLDENAEAVVGTEALVGQYVLVDQRGTVVRFDGGDGRADERVSPTDEESVSDAAVQISDQELTVTADNTTVATRPTTLAFESNRQGYNVTVTIDDVPGRTVEDVFGGSVPVERTADGGVEFRVPDHEYRVPLNRTALDRGSYELEIAVVDSDARASTNVFRLGAQDVAAALPEGEVSTTEGSVAQIPIAFRNADRTTVYVGSRDRNYLASVEVVDSNRTGRVTLSFNTLLAGQSREANRRAFAAENGTIGKVTLHTDPVPNPPLAPGLYRVNTTVNGDAVDETHVAVSAQQTALSEPLTAPGSAYAGLNTSTSIGVALSRGLLSPDSTVATGDVVGYRLRAPGLLGTLAANWEDNESVEQAFAEVATDSSSFAFEVVDRSPDPNDRRDRVALGETARADGLTVVPNWRNGTLSVTLRTDRVVLADGTGERTALEPATDLRTTLNGSERGAADGNQSVSRDWRLVERTVSFDAPPSGTIHLRNATCQVVSGETSLAAGTELELRLRRSDPRSLRSVDTVVDDRGRFGEALDLSDVSDNATFDVSVSDARTTETRLRVADRRPAAVEMRNQSALRDQVTVDTVRVPFGGFVVVYDAQNGSVVGVSERLGNGTTTDVTVGLDEPVDGSRSVTAVTHADVNGNGLFDGRPVDRPYLRECDVVSSRATVLESDGTERETETPVSPPSDSGPGADERIDDSTGTVAQQSPAGGGADIGVVTAPAAQVSDSARDSRPSASGAEAPTQVATPPSLGEDSTTVGDQVANSDTALLRLPRQVAGTSVGVLLVVASGLAIGATVLVWKAVKTAY